MCFFTGKVIAQNLFFNDNDKAAATTVEFGRGRDFYYNFKPNKEAGADRINYNWGFEEVEIIKQLNGNYHVSFYAVSTVNVRSDSPFMILEATKDDLVKWHAEDHWFSGEYHYKVGRAGKRTHGAKKHIPEERCDICGYPAKNNSCPRCSIVINKLENGREKSPHLVAAVNYYVSQGAKITGEFIHWPYDFKTGQMPKNFDKLTFI